MGNEDENLSNTDNIIDGDGNEPNLGEINIDDDNSEDEENNFDEIDIENANREYEDNNDENNRALYPGARIRLGESMIAILTFFLRHSLTGIGLIHLLELIEVHCITPNLCYKSLYSFKKYFANIETPLIRHFYCSNCFCPLGDELTTNCETCPESLRGRSYFIEMSVLNQLQKLYNRFDFFELLQRRFNRNKINNENYEDIYDGKIYREETQPGGKLSDPDNISFTWNTDRLS